MTFSRSAAWLGGLLTIFACSVASAQDPILDGTYELEGEADDGRDEIEIELEIESTDGGVTVTRTEKRPGPNPTWTASGTATADEDGSWSLTVTYTVAGETNTDGLIGGLDGGDANASQPNQLLGVYVFSADNNSVAELLENTTRHAPEDGWTLLESEGERDLKGKTYGELAKEFVVPAFEVLERNLNAFGPQTLPHEAKVLRKEIGRLRDYLDIFSYAYPKGAGLDPWNDLRDDLDDGYEAMGEFKDLYDAQGVEDPADAVYDDAEVSERRDEVLQWLARFTETDRIGFYRFYVKRPRRNRITKRNKDDLSQIYWGGTSIHPQEDDSGLETLGRLERALLEGAGDDYKELDDLKTITKEENEVTFHSFRKALRGTLKIAGYVPQIIEEDENPTDELETLGLTVDRFGELNDRLIAWHLAKDRDQDDRADDLKEEINDAWEELQDWLKDEDVDEEIDDFRKIIEH